MNSQEAPLQRFVSIFIMNSCLQCKYNVYYLNKHLLIIIINSEHSGKCFRERSMLVYVHVEGQNLGSLLDRSVKKLILRVLSLSFLQDDSRRVASTLFPSLSSQLKRKKDHGTYSFLLIKHYFTMCLI